MTDRPRYRRNDSAYKLKLNPSFIIGGLLLSFGLVYLILVCKHTTPITSAELAALLIVAFVGFGFLALGWAKHLAQRAFDR